MEKKFGKNKFFEIACLLLILAVIMVFAYLKVNGTLSLQQNDITEIYDGGKAERYDNISVLNLYGT